MNKNISILGCGWLGKPLAVDLIKEGYKIKGTTTRETKIDELHSLGIKPYIFLIGSENLLLEEILQSDILIITIASKSIAGFKDLVKQIEKSNVKKIIFVSSTSVYEKSNNILTELSPVKSSPLTEIEELFIQNSNFSTTIVRFAGLFGYSRKPGNFHPKGSIIQNPEGFVNMIHQDDCIGIIQSIIKQEVWGEIFNACADTHPTRREFYTKSALLIGNDVPLFEETNEIDYKIISNKKLKEALNYKFKYPNILEIKE